MIELINIYKSFFVSGEMVSVLNDINLSIEEGEFIAIHGPSGSGKTTLMSIIGLLDTPTRGKYKLFDNNIIDYSENAKAEMRNKSIGFVFQDYNLIHSMTIKENIVLPVYYYNNSLNNNDLYEITDKLGITASLDYYPYQLSGGQLQRVAIARALINKPKIIIADEPTGNLDVRNTNQVLDIFSELNDMGQTIIVISHNKDVVDRAKRKIELLDGKIISDVMLS